MSFVCCFWILGFSENRQFAPRTTVGAANLLAETWEKLDLLSSRRDPLCTPRTAWQKVGDFWIRLVRAATPCARRELLGRTKEYLIHSVCAANYFSSREPCFTELFLNFERP